MHLLRPSSNSSHKSLGDGWISRIMVATANVSENIKKL